MTKDYRRELQGLLRKLFQFDSADLDFGIYRIMNYKRDEIEKFIEEDLIKAVDVEFEKYSAKSKEEIEKELEEIKKRIFSTLGEDALLPSGDIKEMYRGSPIAKEFYKKKEDLKNSEMADQHKSEIFSHIYQFFSRYYDEGDFISQRRYSRLNKYAVPYNGEEILLHWANKDQYYIKTGEYFKSYSFNIGDYKVIFRLIEAETDQNNNRGGNRYFLLKDFPENIAYNEIAKELTVFFEYRVLTTAETEKYGTRDIQVQKKILDDAYEKILSRANTYPLISAIQKEDNGQTILEKHLMRYAKKNTTDYFIHKSLKDFFLRELEFYIKSEILMVDDLGSEKEINIENYIDRIKIIKGICLKIIDFLAQIEDFQKMLFEKKKFVVEAEYCMTLDRVPSELYQEIAENPSQINEWRDIFNLKEHGRGTLAQYTNHKIDANYLKTHPYLVVNTRFFDREFSDRLLSSFTDLEEATDGVLINSDNFQALSLLNTRYKSAIDFIYIDPPYNTGNDGFLYKDKYPHSSWLSLFESRMRLALPLLSSSGIFAFSLDDNESYYLNCLLNTSRIGLNKIGEFIWRTRNTDNRIKTNLSVDHEYIYIYSPPCSGIVGREIDRSDFKNPDNDPRGPYTTDPLTGKANANDRPNLHYTITNPQTGDVYPPDPDFGWITDQSGFQLLLSQNLVYWPANPKTGKPRKKRFALEMGERAPISSLGISIKQGEGNQDLSAIFGNKALNFPKPVSVIKTLIDCCSPKESVILDYFAGSGTTAQSVMELNREANSKRKYIIIEMGDYFESILMPRIQKVMFSKIWKDGMPDQSNGTSHIFKYIYLEQYEDTLNNIEFRERDKSIQITLHDLEGYFLRYMLDYETQGSSCRLNIDKLSQPFKYTLKITRNNEIRDEAVNLVETFNYLLGLSIKRIKAFNNNGFYYKAVFGTKGDETATIIWRSTEDLDLEVDKEFIEGCILKEFKADKVYVNSDCFVDGAIPIEPEFKRLMGA